MNTFAFLWELVGI